MIKNLEPRKREETKITLINKKMNKNSLTPMGGELNQLKRHPESIRLKEKNPPVKSKSTLRVMEKEVKSLKNDLKFERIKREWKKTSNN